MRLNEYASTRRTRGSYKIPTSVQKSIPIDEIYADGTWRSGEVYSQMWSVSDINYAMQSDDKKQDILAKMGRIYSNIPTDCWAQLCIVSQRMDEISFERDVLYHRANDGLDAYRVERNRLMKAYAKEIGNVKQHISHGQTSFAASRPTESSSGQVQSEPVSASSAALSAAAWLQAFPV